MSGILDGLVCVITGAGTVRGIGRATAQLFAAHGARVVVADLDLASAEVTRAMLDGADHLALACDIRSREACASVVDRSVEKFGRIDVVVNNAGISQPHRFMTIDDAAYNEMMDINVRGTMLMCQAVIPFMQTRKQGSIINMASVAGQRGGGFYGGAHYSASKAGILGLTKAMAREFGPDGIRVNAVCPGLIDTDISKGGIPADRRATLLAATPLHRAGEASEVAGGCLFLASSLSSYVTGAEIDVNGGGHIH
jgi:NAD(P)-dependent dehydrogenase (short-subunit alcohol dehydrogenase family)